MDNKKTTGVERNGMRIMQMKVKGRVNPKLCVSFEGDDADYIVATFASESVADWFFDTMCDTFLDGLIDGVKKGFPGKENA